jgi:two-component system, chemotaxis family, sensor kinase CheA
MKSSSGQLNFIKRYVGIISALTVFVAVVSGVGAYNYVNGVKLAENSAVLNAIGQEKTLSQKISKDILLIQQEFSSDEKFNRSLFEELLSNKKSFQQLLDALDKGGTVATPDSTGQFRVESLRGLYGNDLSEVSKAWSPLSAQIDGLSKLYNEQIKSKGQDSVDSLLVTRKNRTFVITDQNEVLPNDTFGTNATQNADRAVNPEQNALKGAINADLQETTRILKNNNLQLLNSIDKLNDKLNKALAEQKEKSEQIQIATFGITLTFFIFLLIFFFGRLVKSDSVTFREQKEKNAILENVREGLFLMNENWVIEQKGSAVLSEILGKEITPPMSFLEVIEPMIDEKTARNAKEFVKILFTKDVKESMIASLNPLKLVEIVKQNNANQTVIQKKQFLSINFNKIKDESGKVSKILVTILDSTEQKKLEERLKEEKTKSSSQFDFLLKIIQSKDKGAVIDFFRSLQETVCDQNEKLKTAQTEEGYLINILNTIQREIHTLKSEAGILELTVFQNMLHDFEEKLNEIKKKKPIKAEDLHIISFYHKDILEKTGGIITAIESSAQGENVIASTAISVDSTAKRLENDLRVLVRNNTDKLHKKAQLVVQLNSLDLLNENQKDSLRSILMHMVNNSIAHGIELPEVRNSANKHPLGIVKIYDEVVSDGINKKINFHVVDDGTGIDFNKIKAKALEMGMDAAKAGPQDLLKYIFMPNFSTSEKIDTVSGRGIGMDFVKTEVEKMGGKIGLKLRAGSYTEFYFSIPLND